MKKIICLASVLLSVLPAYADTVTITGKPSIPEIARMETAVKSGGFGGVISLYSTSSIKVSGQVRIANNYLIQYPGYTNATEMRINSPQPQPGIDCEPGSQWAPWVPVNGDQDLHDYVVKSDHSLTHALPVRTAVLLPNPDMAKSLIQNEPGIQSLTPQQRVNLAPFAALLSDATLNLSGVQQTWSDMLATYGPNGSAPQPWLTQTIVTAIQNDCAAANIPLVANKTKRR